jgi:polar amino acid transport system permease protein
MQANAIVAETFLVFEIYFTIAVVYLILTISLSQVVNLMEKRMRAHV